VAGVARLIRRVFVDEWGSSVQAVSLLDAGEAARTLESSTTKRMAFGLKLAAAQAMYGCPWIFYTHASLGQVQRFVPAWWRRPYVVFVHGVEVWSGMTPTLRDTIGRATLRIANSAFTAQRLTRAHPELGDVAVCPLALDPARQAWADIAPRQLRFGPHAVLLVARMVSSERYKGHDALLEAWSSVLTAIPDAHLVFCGEGDDVQRLKAKAASLGIGCSVTFTGFVSDEGLDALYQQVALFAMPSRGEGFGLVYLEAMSRGLPCIGSVHDAAGEVIQDGVTGRLVDQSDREQLAGSIIRILADDGVRRAMGARGRERLEKHFSYDRFARTLTGILSGAFGVQAAGAIRAVSSGQ